MAACVVVYTIHAYVSNLNNMYPGKYTLWLYISGIIPLWTFMSAYSKDVAFDGIMFDVTVTLTYAIAINAFAHRGFTFINWAGVGTVLLGLLMIKNR